jgi:hypothetical protein
MDVCGWMDEWMKGRKWGTKVDRLHTVGHDVPAKISAAYSESSLSWFMSPYILWALT